MIRTVPENRVGDLLRMVSSGGAFAEAIFIAFSTATRAGLAKAKDDEAAVNSKGTKEKDDVDLDKKAKTSGEEDVRQGKEPQIQAAEEGSGGV